jgi:hypothetical protein
MASGAGKGTAKVAGTTRVAQNISNSRQRAAKAARTSRITQKYEQQQAAGGKSCRKKSNHTKICTATGVANEQQKRQEKYGITQ